MIVSNAQHGQAQKLANVNSAMMIKIQNVLSVLMVGSCRRMHRIAIFVTITVNLNTARPALKLINAMSVISMLPVSIRINLSAINVKETGSI